MSSKLIYKSSGGSETPVVSALSLSSAANRVPLMDAGNAHEPGKPQIAASSSVSNNCQQQPINLKQVVTAAGVTSSGHIIIPKSDSTKMIVLRRPPTNQQFSPLTVGPQRHHVFTAEPVRKMWGNTGSGARFLQAPALHWQAFGARGLQFSMQPQASGFFSTPQSVQSAFRNDVITAGTHHAIDGSMCSKFNEIYSTTKGITPEQNKVVQSTQFSRPEKEAIAFIGSERTVTSTGSFAKALSNVKRTCITVQQQSSTITTSCVSVTSTGTCTVSTGTKGIDAIQPFSFPINPAYKRRQNERRRFSSPEGVQAHSLDTACTMDELKQNDTIFPGTKKQGSRPISTIPLRRYVKAPTAIESSEIPSTPPDQSTETANIAEMNEEMSDLCIKMETEEETPDFVPVTYVVEITKLQNNLEAKPSNDDLIEEMNVRNCPSNSTVALPEPASISFEEFEKEQVEIETSKRKQKSKKREKKFVPRTKTQRRHWRKMLETAEGAQKRNTKRRKRKAPNKRSSDIRKASSESGFVSSSFVNLDPETHQENTLENRSVTVIALEKLPLDSLQKEAYKDPPPSKSLLTNTPEYHPESDRASTPIIKDIPPSPEFPVDIDLLLNGYVSSNEDKDSEMNVCSETSPSHSAETKKEIKEVIETTPFDSGGTLGDAVDGDLTAGVFPDFGLNPSDEEDCDVKSSSLESLEANAHVSCFRNVMRKRTGQHQYKGGGSTKCLIDVRTRSQVYISKQKTFVQNVQNMTLDKNTQDKNTEAQTMWDFMEHSVGRDYSELNGRRARLTTRKFKKPRLDLLLRSNLNHQQEKSALKDLRMKRLQELCAWYRLKDCRVHMGSGAISVKNLTNSPYKKYLFKPCFIGLNDIMRGKQSDSFRMML